MAAVLALMLVLAVATGAPAQDNGTLGGQLGYGWGVGPSAEEVGGGILVSVETGGPRESAWSVRLSATYLDLRGELYGSDGEFPQGARHPDVQGLGLALGAQIRTRGRAIRTYALVEAGPYWLWLNAQSSEQEIRTLGLALGGGVEAVRSHVTPYLEARYHVLATDYIAPEGKAGRLLTIAVGGRIQIVDF